jgi:hypothetical protein
MYARFNQWNDLTSMICEQISQILSLAAASAQTAQSFKAA